VIDDVHARSSSPSAVSDAGADRVRALLIALPHTESALPPKSGHEADIAAGPRRATTGLWTHIGFAVRGSGSPSAFGGGNHSGVGVLLIIVFLVLPICSSLVVNQMSNSIAHQ
jgi:hypothetical protein